MRHAWIALLMGGCVGSSSLTLPIVYDPPITITKGGSYSGNWESKNAAVPAVNIQTTEAVTLENCNLRSQGNLIAAKLPGGGEQTGVNLTLRGCRGYGAEFGGKPRAYMFRLVFPQSVVVENNYWQDIGGAVLVGDNTFANVKTLKFLRNQTRNTDGLVQFNGFLKVGGLEIAWNEAINQPRKARPEDVINIYNSSGLPDNPIRIHHNYIQGAYPANPQADPFTGSGINAGDGDTTADAEHSPSNVHAYQNQVISTANVGIFIAAGNNNRLYENRVVSSGLLPDGNAIKNFFTGIYVWDCCYNQVPRGVFFNNYAYNNTIGNAGINDKGQSVRSDSKLDDCAKNPDGSSKCTGNISMPGPITLQTEADEYKLWQAKVKAAGVKIGP